MRARRALARLGWAARRLAGHADPVILMYHRVADVPIDPWGLAVRPATFEAQMETLARTRRPVSLDWLAAELRAGRRPSGAVAVTFDDAYRDIHENAWPALRRHRVPATVFVVPGALGRGAGYWWDRLAALVLGHPVPATGLPLPAASPDVETARAAGDRPALHLALWRALRALPADDLERALERLVAAYGTPPLPEVAVMTEAQLREMTADGLVRLGAHTMTHPSLPAHAPDVQRREIEESRRAVERLTGHPVAAFAYPYGDHDATTASIVKALGFDVALGVEAGPANDWGDRFSLPRVDVKDWPEGRFRQALAWHA